MSVAFVEIAMWLMIDTLKCAYANAKWHEIKFSTQMEYRTHEKAREREREKAGAVAKKEHNPK